MGVDNARRVVVIVPFNEWNEWVLDCVRHCTYLVGAEWIIWLLPDTPPPKRWAEALDAMDLGDRIHVEPTGAGNPARKRNVALRKSGADLFALVDSDAWPCPDWLVTGLPLLKDNVAVVAGPNLTPPTDPLSRRVSGRVMESPFGFGGGYIRHVRAKQQLVREMPTCNMILRRTEGIFFREDLDTGEDMMYCSDVRAHGMTILYDPGVVVFHHRRRMGGAFIRQFFRYGLDKGALARQSSDIAYVWQAFPALLVLYWVVLALISVIPLPVFARCLAWAPMGVYAVTVLGESCRLAHSVGEMLLTPFGFVTAHVSYGVGYLRGVFRAS